MMSNLIADLLSLFVTSCAACSFTHSLGLTCCHKVITQEIKTIRRYIQRKKKKHIMSAGSTPSCEQAAI